MHSCYPQLILLVVSAGNSMPRIPYVSVTNGSWWRVHLTGGKYCLERNTGRRAYVYTEMQPQLSESAILTLIKAEGLSQLSIEGNLSIYALAEYAGSFPGHVPHGNSERRETIYRRTTPMTLEANAGMTDIEPPKVSYEDLTKQSEIGYEPRDV
jgi:hypothetical protein